MWISRLDYRTLPISLWVEHVEASRGVCSESLTLMTCGGKSSGKWQANHASAGTKLSALPWDGLLSMYLFDFEQDVAIRSLCYMTCCFEYRSDASIAKPNCSVSLTSCNTPWWPGVVTKCLQLPPINESMMNQWINQLINEVIDHSINPLCLCQSVIHLIGQPACPHKIISFNSNKIRVNTPAKVAWSWPSWLETGHVSFLGHLRNPESGAVASFARKGTIHAGL